MAYTKTGEMSGLDTVFDNSYVTKNELYAILEQLKKSERFYELEIFEVVSVDDINVGEVTGRYVVSEQGDTIEEIEDRTILPLNSNIIQFPLRGELWLGIEYKGNHYYLSRLSEDIRDINFEAFNESTKIENQTSDSSRGKNFIDIKPSYADVKIGDTLLQGRFDNYINLGSVENTGSIQINNNSSLLSMTNIEEPRVQILSDKFVVGANDTIDLIADKDININSSQGDVNIESESNIVLNPRNSTIEFDIKNGGTILSSTKEGIPFPELNMSGFLKQTMGIQKLFQALTLGVPKLSNPATLPSGVKDIVKGLEGAKNFIEATLNLEFLEKEILTTKTPEEIAASLPIPAGIKNIVGDIQTFSEGIDENIKKLEKVVSDNAPLLENAQLINNALESNDRTAILNTLESVPSDILQSIPGGEDTLSMFKSSKLKEKDIIKARENGAFTQIENYLSETATGENDLELMKSYGKILNLTKQEQKWTKIN